MPPSESNKRRHNSEPPPLSAREIRFCQKCVEYGKKGQTRAYLEAGFPEGDTPNATEKAASRRVRKRQVREYLKYLRQIAADAAKLTTEEIVAGIRNIAVADRRKLFDSKGRILPPDEWPDDVAATVEGIETEELYERDPSQKGRKELIGHARKVKTAGRQAAWNKLAEIKGLVGADKDKAGKAVPPPLVVGGEADVEVV